MYHQIRGSLEPRSTQDSFERALADELSTTVTASDSLPATKQKDNINQYREEEIDDKYTEKELPIATVSIDKYYLFPLMADIILNKATSQE